MLASNKVASKCLRPGRETPEVRRDRLEEEGLRPGLEKHLKYGETVSKKTATECLRPGLEKHLKYGETVSKKTATEGLHPELMRQLNKGRLARGKLRKRCSNQRLTPAE
ncbi:hypothetical protein AVEN_175716-1 [Araneus ventricosus]|uniref:Uncharacterized protein n=1 Tax=Araneus ventricosus TaxID=182803 RepID=A0A4Y2G5Z8_ARAVE|nr:hypothetical protein AVEN_175716-1 [Araneus ventricosus]